MYYDYEKAVTADVKDYAEGISTYELAEFDTIEDLKEHLNDVLWAEDSVTGNGSGSYTDEETAGEYLAGNWDLMRHAVEEFEVPFPTTAVNADVAIRCYLLGEAIGEALSDEGLLERWEMAREGAAIEAMEQDGWAGSDVSLKESLREYGFAVRKEDDLIITLYRNSDDGAAALYYENTRTVTQYREDYGIMFAEEDSATDIACRLEEEMARNKELIEDVTGAADAWASNKLGTLAELFL